MRINTLSLVLSSLLLLSCQSSQSRKGQTAKNAIFFIGDGMGIAQMTSGRLYKGGSFHKMNYENFEVTGFAKTYSSDNFTTDSAAGATALAAGVKSYNGAISMTDPKWEKTGISRRLETLTDLAKAAGKSVGIITTTRITHATPASFFAHALQRKSEAKIAQQVLDSNVDLWIGGGRAFFLPKSKGGYRKDNRDILSELNAKGGFVAHNFKEVENIENLDKQVLALFSKSHIEYKQAGKSEAYLDKMVKESIRLLSQNPKGYFLMVEGGRVDHASHINEEEKMMAEMVDLDSAVGEAMATVDKEDTLIVMTADHETAGLSISGYGPHSLAEGKRILGKTIGRNEKEVPRPIITWATGPGESLNDMHAAAHTAIDVPVAASGPRAYTFTGWMDNTEIPLKIASAMGLQFSSSVNMEMIEVLKSKEK